MFAYSHHIGNAYSYAHSVAFNKRKLKRTAKAVRYEPADIGESFVPSLDNRVDHIQFGVCCESGLDKTVNNIGGFKNL